MRGRQGVWKAGDRSLIARRALIALIAVVPLSPIQAGSKPAIVGPAAARPGPIISAEAGRFQLSPTSSGRPSLIAVPVSRREMIFRIGQFTVDSTPSYTNRDFDPLARADIVVALHHHF